MDQPHLICNAFAGPPWVSQHCVRTGIAVRAFGARNNLTARRCCYYLREVVMLRLLSRGLLVTALGLSYIAYNAPAAYAQDDDFDDEEEGDGEGKGGGEGDSEEGDDEEDDKDQPPITAGGLFTLKSYPVREISRPLSMTQKIVQVRASAGTDISAKGAFESGGLSVEGLYGYTDNFALMGGFTNAYNMKQFGLYFGFEGALAYDLVNLRLAANVYRNAIPGFGFFCKPVSSADNVNQTLPLPSQCASNGATIVSLPDGNYTAGGTKFSIDIGLPFRYAIKPEIAIVALQTLMSIDFNSVSKGYVRAEPKDFAGPDNDGDGMPDETITVLTNVPVGNGAKPDLKPSIGIATNPVAPLSVVIFAQLRIPDFDTEAGAFQVPVTGRLQFSPNQKFDIGLEFTLLNVKPPEGQSAIDNRFIALFVQARAGQ